MLTQGFDEIVNVRAHNLDAHCVGPTDFLRNACLVPSLLYQLENFRPNDIDRKHLPVTDIEKDSPILGVCASNGVGRIQHGLVCMPRSCCLELKGLLYWAMSHPAKKEARHFNIRSPIRSTACKEL